MTLSLYMFCFSANPIFPSLYISMRSKQHFYKVLIVTFGVATFCYVAIRIIGYLMYGSTVISQITLNLPKERLSSKVAIYIAWLTPLTKYALLMKPVWSTIQTQLPQRYQRVKLVKISLTTLLVISQVVVGLCLPFFGSLMSLVGALCSATASITIPCVCYLKIRKINIRSAEGIVVVLLALLSIVLIVMGTYTSLRSIVANVSKHG